MSNVVATESFSITMERKCLCPLIVTHGVDQVQCRYIVRSLSSWGCVGGAPLKVPISSRFSMREDAVQLNRAAADVVVLQADMQCSCNLSRPSMFK